jgi:hypothetical protein
MTEQTRINAIASHLARITPGPWWWGGNVDCGDVEISTRGKFGTESVLRMLNVDRKPNDRRVAGIEEYFSDSDDPDGAAQAVEEFLFEDCGVPNKDPFMAFNVDGYMTPAKDLAVYEVCRDATSREDRRVYRGDVVGIRHPDAQFIVDAPTYVRELIEIATQQAETIAVLQERFVAPHTRRGCCSDHSHDKCTVCNEPWPCEVVTTFANNADANTD